MRPSLSLVLSVHTCCSPRLPNFGLYAALDCFSLSFSLKASLEDDFFRKLLFFPLLPPSLLIVEFLIPLADIIGFETCYRNVNVSINHAWMAFVIIIIIIIALLHFSAISFLTFNIRDFEGRIFDHPIPRFPLI